MFNINSDYDILTPNGWQNFDGINQSFKQTLIIYFRTGSPFICTLDHLLYTNKQLIRAAAIKPGMCISGLIVVSIKLHEIIDVYDPVNVEGGNLYYSNGIISHNCSFLGSSSTLINSETISKLFTKELILCKDGLDIHQQPVDGHSYVMTVDPSKGVGGDSSCFSIIDVTCLPYVLVGKYKNNTISPMLFPNVIHRVAMEYNEAFVLIEINVSEQIPHILYHDIGYENIMMVSRQGNKGQCISGGFGNNSQLGLQMDKKVKNIGCHNLKILLDEAKLFVHDTETIAELSTFIDNGKGSFAADDGYHDDLVMTLVMFGWLTTQSYFKDINNIDIRAKIYAERMDAIDNEMLPPGFLCDGSEEVDHELAAFLR